MLLPHFALLIVGFVVPQPALAVPQSHSIPVALPPIHTMRTRSQAANQPTLSAASPAKMQPSADDKGSIRPYIVLAALVLLFMINQWTRNLPSFLVAFDAAGQAGRTGRELMNLALGFDAQQYGLLVSYGFTLLYVAMSFPAGIACDRFPRKNVLLLSAAGWSAATAAAAASASYLQLLGSRVFLGMSQAFSGPAAHTLISTTFPPHRRATANAIYTSGIYLGAALASVSVVLAKAIGWRSTCWVVAFASLPPAILLALALPSEKQPAATAAASPSIPAAAPAASSASVSAARQQGSFARVLSVRSVRWLLLGATARLFAGFAIGAWAAPYYRSAFPSRQEEYAFCNALIVAGGGTFAAVSGGVLADRLSAGGAKSEANKGLLPMLGALGAIPFWLVAVRSSHFPLAMGSLLCAYLCAETWYGATIAMLQGALPRRVWGTAQGTLNLVQIVANTSPLLLGALHRRGAPLRTLLSVTIPAAYVVTALCFGRAVAARKAEGEVKED